MRDLLVVAGGAAAAAAAIYFYQSSSRPKSRAAITLRCGEPVPPELQASCAVIGGSGLYEMNGFTDIVEVEVETPFGQPSDAYVLGKLNGVKVAFLSRHGRGHLKNPSEVNYRANIYGMKRLGVKWILAVTACGSLRMEIKPVSGACDLMLEEWRACCDE